MSFEVDTGVRPEVEPEVMWARRGFPKAQELLAGVALSTVEPSVAVGWYDSPLHPEHGSFCVVKRASVYEDLLGEILIFTTGQKVVYAYCVATADIDLAVNLHRVPFSRLFRLSRSSIACKLEIRV